MIGITIQWIQYIDRNVAITIVEKGEVEMKYNIERKEKLIRIWITMIRHGGLGIRFKSHGLIYQMCLPRLTDRVT